MIWNSYVCQSVLLFNSFTVLRLEWSVENFDIWYLVLFLLAFSWLIFKNNPTFLVHLELMWVYGTRWLNWHFFLLENSINIESVLLFQWLWLPFIIYHIILWFISKPSILFYCLVLWSFLFQLILVIGIN